MGLIFCIAASLNGDNIALITTDYKREITIKLHRYTLHCDRESWRLVPVHRKDATRKRICYFSIENVKKAIPHRKLDL